MKKFLPILRLAHAVSLRQWPWALLALLGLGLEACGLYFQYGLNLLPCINCVYERAVYLYGFILPGLLGTFLFFSPAVRVLCLCLMAVSAVSGIYIAADHLMDYYGTGGACALRAEFFLIPLDRLLPSVFMPEGSCGPLDWSFLGLSMPVWVMVSYVCALGTALTGLASQAVRACR